MGRPRQPSGRCLGLALVLSARIAGAEPIHDWDLQEDQWRNSELTDGVAQRVARASSPPRFRDGAVVMDDDCHLEVAEIGVNDLPTAALSVEAWVALERGQRWGNVVGFLQDNGSYERGWSLGYNETEFLFWISTGGSLVAVKSDRPFVASEWTHLVGTYDGKEMRLYVNGTLVGRTALEGAIAYPETARFTMGAYRDDNEFYPMRGALRRVKLYNHALGPEEIVVPVSRTTGALQFSIRPSVKFLESERARVQWALVGENTEGEEIVEYGKAERFDRIAESRPTSKGDRVASLEGLDPQSIYHFRIRRVNQETGKKDRPSPIYELNTSLNFTVPRLKSQARDAAPVATVTSLLESVNLRKGYALMLGEPDVTLAAELARQSEFSVVGIDTDRDRIDAARRRLYPTGLYGSRVTLMAVESMKRLPLAAGLADLVICPRSLADSMADEIDRVLAPGRGVQAVSEEVGWALSRRSREVGMGEWTHQYGDSGNTTTSGEALGGARCTDDLAVHWFGRPGADFGLDRQSRMPAPLAVNGRLFHQGMQRLVALNAHNGSVLWGLEIPDLMRLNMPRDASNWCADSANLFVAVRERLWVLDAETGEREVALGVPGDDEGMSDWGYVGRAGNYLLGSAVRPDSGYRSYWSGKMWFDGKAGSIGTAKVCSDSLFALSRDDWESAWEYRGGRILNTTIAVDEGRVIFVESRNPALASLETSRLSGPELWQDQVLVALDLASGNLLWERPLDTEDGSITFYLQVAAGTILVTASNTSYHLYAFAADSGNPRWNRSNAWPDDHHSGHIQHPVILDGTVYLQPNGYDLATGEILTTKVGSRSGCHTYIGAEKALIYRGEGRRVALWDREAESVSAWDRLRPSCWLSLIPANGMLLVPEGGGGCSCGGWMETSIGFAPRPLRKKSETEGGSK